MKTLITCATRNTGLGIVYGLYKEGHSIVGADDRKLLFNIHSRHINSSYLHAALTDKKFYKDIVSIIRLEKPDILIPVSGTGQISFFKQEIKELTNILVPDYNSYLAAFNKKETYRICRETGIAVPELYSYSEAVKLLHDRGNPKLVIKPGYDAGGARGLKIINNVEQLDAARENIIKIFGDFIIQEYIPGASSMRSVQLLFNKENKVIANFVLKKIHQWPVSGGITSYAVSTHEWDLVSFVLPFFGKCKWKGPVEIELIIDERDRKPKLIEINPRFSGTVSFPVQCGVNFPHLTCIAAKNKNYSIDPPCYSAGIIYINPSYFLKSFFKEFYLAKNKTAFLYKTYNELKDKKVSTSPDKKDIIMYLAKSFSELTALL